MTVRSSIRLAEYFERPLRLTPSEGGRAARRRDGRSSPSPARTNGPLATALDKVEQAARGPWASSRSMSASTDQLERLTAAAHDGEQLELDYYSAARDELTTRVVDPVRVFHAVGAWYLAAYCHRAAPTGCSGSTGSAPSARRGAGADASRRRRRPGRPRVSARAERPAGAPAPGARRRVGRRDGPDRGGRRPGRAAASTWCSPSAAPPSSSGCCSSWGPPHAVLEPPEAGRGAPTPPDGSSRGTAPCRLDRRR